MAQIDHSFFVPIVQIKGIPTSPESHKTNHRKPR